MLKKIQNVWNYILKKKKLTNNVNLYSIKNNLLFTNAVANSLIFYISGLKNIKLKKISILNKNYNFLNFYNFILFILFFIFISFFFYLVFFI